MWKGGEISMENPGDQDPGMVELIQSDECAEVIIQRRLENPPHVRHPSDDCCNRCDPTLHMEREYQWIEVDPAPSTGPKSTKNSTEAQRKTIYNKLVAWRLVHWRQYWKQRWPSYGPKSLIPDSDLEDLSTHTSKIFCIEDMRRYTHIAHWLDLSPSLFDALQNICGELNLLPDVVIEEPTVEEPQWKRRK
ncbi:hypothetical protein B0H17DRAFT_963245 [Mycena rosella]|uniref:Uncharacterized protein n=1 Tax=Mycena rosella TaxID=1033263 RepID=A0AAD7BP64_MYCRO|nr:hypothetical protein B0H17DRAFT_963245 [Mycena rosella]